MSSTWNPADKGSAITLSNGNLKATAGSFSESSVRSTASLSAGSENLRVFKITVDKAGSSGSLGVGVANQNMNINSWAGETNNSMAWWNDGNIYKNNAIIGSIGSYTTGDVLTLAFDLTSTTIKFWGKKNSGNWNNSGSANPNTGAGAITFTITGNQCIPCATLEETNEAVTYDGASDGGLSAALPWDGAVEAPPKTFSQAVFIF